MGVPVSVQPGGGTNPSHIQPEGRASPRDPRLFWESGRWSSRCPGPWAPVLTQARRPRGTPRLGLRPSLGLGSHHAMGSRAPALPCSWQIVSDRNSCNNVGDSTKSLVQAFQSWARTGLISQEETAALPFWKPARAPGSLCPPFSWRLRNQVPDVLQTQFLWMKNGE